MVQNYAHLAETAMGFYLSQPCPVQVPSFGAGLKFKKKVVGYFHNIHATIAQVGISFHASHYYSS